MRSSVDIAGALSHGVARPEGAAPRELCVWRVALDAPELRAAELEKLLSEDERLRASQYRFDHSRRAFVATRTALRCLLADRTGTRPDEVRLAYGESGKPSLAGDRCDVRFNVSHSGDVALIAVTSGYEVGVDVERVRPVPDALDIAKRFFTSREAALIGAAPEGQREQAFLSLWTRKEACLKASGRGLLTELAALDVSVPPAARFIGGDPTKVQQAPMSVWFRDVRVGEGLMAVVAATVEDWSLVVLDFDFPSAGCSGGRVK